MTRPAALLAALVALLVSILAARADTVATTNETDTAVVTNVFLVSPVVTQKAWTRQAVLATPSNTIKDLSGVFVEAAEAAVHSNEAARIEAVSAAAIEGMRNAFAALYAVTGNIKRTAHHIALVVPPSEAPSSLQGFVVKETTDGVTDTQWVWYSHILPTAPVRRVVYTTPAGKFSQAAKWENWSKDGEDMLAVDGRVWRGCHKCTITRPEAARRIPALSRQNERFGGADGFDFGAALVTVGGRPTFTGTITNDITGEVVRFDNGVHKGGATK